MSDDGFSNYYLLLSLGATSVHSVRVPTFSIQKNCHLFCLRSTFWARKMKSYNTYSREKKKKSTLYNISQEVP